MCRRSISRRHLLLGATGMITARNVAAQTTPASAARFSRERFVEAVRDAAGEADAQAAIEIQLQRALAKPRAVLDEIGAPRQAGIHTLYRGTDVTILNVVWAPLMVLLPHNHNMWASIGIYTGREDNIIWDRRAGSLAPIGAAALESGQVFGLSAEAIHSVVNPIGRLTGAIHIYGGDFFAPGRSEWDPETLAERPWDLAAASDEFARAAQRFEAVP
jgi:predicted metal-dependent enzyme (double-stranded beta helix superfamily)